MLNRSLSGLERTQDWDMWVYVLCVIWQGEAGKKPEEEAAAWCRFPWLFGGFRSQGLQVVMQNWQFP